MPSPDDLAAIKAERDAAERAYNDTLTRLDRALQVFPADFPFPPPAPDEHQVTSLNTLWKIDRAATTEGWRGRLGTVVSRLMAPLFRRQEAFNAAVVDHLNRQLGFAHDTRRSIAATRDMLAELLELQRRLLEFLQQITPYVDTRDRDVAGLLRGLSGAINVVADEVMKKSEAMLARDRRHETRVSDLEASLAAIRQQMLDLQKALQR
ncbi:MAG: hypothetical protein HY047_01990 [Acidobacteria bacterium]|nr:hypothetical protein [Acidobacteriota bacterium]